MNLSTFESLIVSKFENIPGYMHVSRHAQIWNNSAYVSFCVQFHKVNSTAMRRALQLTRDVKGLIVSIDPVLLDYCGIRFRCSTDKIEAFKLKKVSKRKNRKGARK